jgi:hypothetical protein
MPDFVTAATLPNERAAGGSEQVSKSAIELRRH